ncbi:MAG: hypothetical protein ACLGH8_12500 [Bacteroidia bacterium]
MNENSRLFGLKTKRDWGQVRAKIILNINDGINWEEAFELFELRLNTRYFEPINAILSLREYKGEGFAAITLVCSLVEFLQSSFEGKYYVYKASEIGAIYSKSKEMFIRFLTSHKPFNEVFNDYKKAEGFYKNIRCGLLHEAATKEDWTILRSSSNCFVDINNKVLYTDEFIKAIKVYIEDYKQSILKNEDNLRFHLARKLDKLADIKEEGAWW